MRRSPFRFKINILKEGEKGGEEEGGVRRSPFRFKINILKKERKKEKKKEE